MRFRSRAAAGAELGEVLRDRDWNDLVVLAMPSGGIPVAAEVASRLAAPLDIVDVHDITGPREDIGVGTVDSATGGTNPATAKAAGLSEQDLSADEEHHREALSHLMSDVRASRPEEPLAGRTVIVVDDALAVAPAVSSAAAHARERGAALCVLAVPVGSDALVEKLADIFDEVVCLERAERIDRSVWYDELPAVSADEVISTITRPRR